MKRRKGRHHETAPNQAKDRKYTSYEDEPLKEYNETIPVPANLTKKFINVFLILLIAVMAALAFFYIDVLTPENISHWFHYELLGKTEGEGFPVRYEGISIEPENFSLIDNCPVYCSDTSAIVLNSNAGVYLDSQHSYAKPVMKTNKGYAIVYNSDATGYEILNRNSVVYSGTASKKIFDADVSSGGVYGVLTYGDDYLANLTVYKNDNTKRYSYSFADYYVNRISISNNDARIAISGVSAKDGGLISVIYILDMNQENYLQKYEVEDTYIYDIVYLDNGNVAAVGDTGAFFIDVKNGKKTDISYSNRVLTTFRLCRDYGALLSLSENPDGRSCEIVGINNTGKTDINFDTENRLLSLDINGKAISALFPSQIAVYNFNGKKLASAAASTDTRKICLCNDKKTLYTLGKSEITKTTLDYDASKM